MENYYSSRFAYVEFVIVGNYMEILYITCIIVTVLLLKYI